MSERHPIEVSPHRPLEARVTLLEHHLAQLWDAVWWLSLPSDVRAEYERQGFTAPIKEFYPANGA